MAKLTKIDINGKKSAKMGKKLAKMAKSSQNWQTKVNTHSEGILSHLLESTSRPGERSIHAIGLS